jgi:hypothetical protein
MSRALLLRHLAPAAVLTLAWAGQANASPLGPPPITLPHNLDFLATSGPGPVDPALLVGFNPQPDPPGDNAAIDLRNPSDPSIDQPGSGVFTILFGMHGHGPGGDPYSFTVPTGGPLISGRLATFKLLAQGDGSVFQASFDISGYTGGWVDFNPQPDPPGFGGSFVGFSFISSPLALDPIYSWTLQEGHLDPNGLFGLLVARRRRAA